MDVLDSLIKSLHKSIEQKDDKIRADILVKISQYYFNENEYTKAKINLLQVLKLNPKYVNVNYYLGLVEFNLGNDDDGKMYIKRELKINPSNELAKEILEKFEVQSNFPRVTLTAFVLSLLIFLFSYPEPSYSSLLKFGVSNFNLTIFSLITSIFFHANWIHFVLNTTFLLMFGFHLEKYIGSVKFLSIFILGGIIGNLMQVLFSTNGFVIGMSSSIFAIFGAVVIREPLLEFRVFGIFKVPVVLLFGMIFAVQWVLGFSYGSSTNMIYGELAHIFGFFTGAIFLVFFNYDYIHTFINWLIISLGFLISAFALSSIYRFILEGNILGIVINIFTLIFGVLLIIYIYYILKRFLGISKEEVK